MGSAQTVHDRPKSIDNPPARPVHLTSLKKPSYKKVILLGLSNSGKTTFAKQLQRSEDTQDGLPTPPITLWMEASIVPLYGIQLFDMAGGPNYRAGALAMLNDKDVIIFFIDLQEKNPGRIQEIKEFLTTVDKSKDRRQGSLLYVVGSKRDIADPMDWSGEVNIEPINCLRAHECHRLMKKITDQMNQMVREYEKPEQSQPIPSPPVVKKDLPPPTTSYCKWIW